MFYAILRPVITRGFESRLDSMQAIPHHFAAREEHAPILTALIHRWLDAPGNAHGQAHKQGRQGQQHQRGGRALAGCGGNSKPCAKATLADAQPKHRRHGHEMEKRIGVEGQVQS